jgi:hypothetical protein
MSSGLSADGARNALRGLKVAPAEQIRLASTCASNSRATFLGSRGRHAVHLELHALACSSGDRGLSEEWRGRLQAPRDAKWIAKHVGKATGRNCRQPAQDLGPHASAVSVSMAWDGSGGRRNREQTWFGLEETPSRSAR